MAVAPNWFLIAGAACGVASTIAWVTALLLFSVQRWRTRRQRRALKILEQLAQTTSESGQQ
ncbi:hypothetical protein [Xanthomonas floridensis]|uniref:Lipopolysaccharide assembly protein A domain-containing protein n=1 Tax=Xanthomonas floridensis TaxID=1843580 RepID=A0A1A9MC93_9XANT|nr:hypothetical protein [Xanthomonas floridensis]MEA5123278.1 hypothetical protein [Xanthomonas floridensis]MEA5132755.1 hypothetical protein [Xanthomonas floridensis]OAG67679.1 hypothetical protein A7D17_15940 [Xanthomonas floridensis]